MTVQDFFGTSLFRVPDYQRAYAWEKKQWEDLWDDVREGMRTGTSHFLGTVVLMAEDENVRDQQGRALRVFQIVDGQQRLTTVCLLLLALDQYLRKEHSGIAEGVWRDFIAHEDDLQKITLGGLNKDYFLKLFSSIRGNSDLPDASRSTNVRLRDAVRRFRDLMDSWVRMEGTRASFLDLASYLRESLQLLRFVTDDRQLAIKTFQVVNDRGKGLSLLDKTKSFLMFYATRYLEDDLDLFREIEEAFGQVFDNYDTVRDLATEYDVGYFVRPQFRFNEDEFLRYAYHYGMRDLRSAHSLDAQYEYGITPERVFDYFIKNACRQLRKTPLDLRKFVDQWCRNLIMVSDALVSLLERIGSSPMYEQFFRFQGPNASVYPLVIGAEAAGLLDSKLLEGIAVLDLRVYQVRGTDPKAELYRESISKLKRTGDERLYQNILDFCRSFGSDRQLDSILRGHVYRQSFTKYVLWKYASADDDEVYQQDYELYANCQVDHILPDDPSTFDPTTFGFDADEDYEAAKHGFGNLSVLEERLNKWARNMPPGEKGRVYGESRLAVNRVLGDEMRRAGFRRDHQERRTAEIVDFFKTTWPIPAREPVEGK